MSKRDDLADMARAVLNTDQRHPAYDEALHAVLRQLLDEREAMLATLTATQDRCTQLLELARLRDRRGNVGAFFQIANQPERDTPGVPDEAELRLGLSLVAEECFELLDAALHDYVGHYNFNHLESLVQLRIRGSSADGLSPLPLRVRMAALADATIDLDYVVEGLRRRLGINGEPLWAEVHAKNLAKRGGPKDPVTGKQLKPEGWTPPDIERLLREQGWQGDNEPSPGSEGA